MGAGECMEAVSGELSFFPLPNCFELFGFDLLVDDVWHVWLLEANAEPDFAQTGGRLKPLVQGVVQQTLQLVTRSIQFREDGTVQLIPPADSQEAQKENAACGHWAQVFQCLRRS